MAQDIAVKLGVLNDRSGVYADLSGEGSVVAARMAVEDFKAADKGMNVEIVSADHQNKPDIGSNIARQWYDVDGVNAILDVPTSSVALAVCDITAEKNGVLIDLGRGLHLADPRAVPPDDGALDLRHRRAGQRHRRGDDARRAARSGSS